MILTKSKSSQLSQYLVPGLSTLDLYIDGTTPSGNFWVDWAQAFVFFCEDKLGLEIEKGPGTSMGIIQNDYGPVRYQFDCDWTQPEGRVSGLEQYEKGFTLWQNTTLWNEDDISEEAETTNINLRETYGIDLPNKRFDFIVWFTSESNDTRNDKEGERLGIRFKYPLTNERGYGCSYYISLAPVCLPWKKKNKANVNNSFLHAYDETIQGLGRTNSLSAVDSSYLFGLYKYDDSQFLSTKSFTTTNLDWKNYADNSSSELELLDYSDLGGSYATYRPEYFSGENLGGTNANIVPVNISLIISNDFNTINFRIENKSNDVFFDIIYGNLMEEKVNENYVTNSFVMLKNTSDNYMSQFLITDNNYFYHPSKQINRPVTLDLTQQLYCGISRVLLQGEQIHCQSLYQVFSFSNLMSNIYAVKQVFVDNNNEQHSYLVYNYGSGKFSNGIDYTNAINLAVPVGNN